MSFDIPPYNSNKVGEGVVTPEPPPPHPPPQHPLALPPPPPPPPVGQFAPPFATQYENGPGSMPSTTRHPVVERLANKHEELQDFGDEVVGLRFRVAAKRKKLRDLRIETSEKDGLVFNLVRQYLHASQLHLPRHIEDAFNDASSLRDKLGPMEAEYDDAEADYNTLEWSYTDKERRFMDELSDSGLVASGVYKRVHNLGRHDSSSLTEFSDCYPEAWNHTAFGDPSGSESNPEPLIKMLSNEKERFEREDQEANESVQTPPRSYLSSKMRRVNVWVLKIIEESPVQRSQLREAIGLKNFDDKTWWSFAKQLLAQENRSVTVFHIGDSTMSPSKHTQPASTISMAKSGIGRSVKEENNDICLESELPVLDVVEPRGIQDISRWEDKTGDSNEKQRAPSGFSGTTDIVCDSDMVNETTSHHTSCSNAPIEGGNHVLCHSSSGEICVKPPETTTFENPVYPSASDLGTEKHNPSLSANPVPTGQDSPGIHAPSVTSIDEDSHNPTASSIKPPSNIKNESLPSVLQEGCAERLEAEITDTSQAGSITTPLEKRRWSSLDPEPITRSPKRHAGSAFDDGTTHRLVHPLDTAS